MRFETVQWAKSIELRVCSGIIYISTMYNTLAWMKQFSMKCSNIYYLWRNLQAVLKSVSPLTAPVEVVYVCTHMPKPLGHNLRNSCTSLLKDATSLFVHSLGNINGLDFPVNQAEIKVLVNSSLNLKQEQKMLSRMGLQFSFLIHAQDWNFLDYLFIFWGNWARAWRWE